MSERLQIQTLVHFTLRIMMRFRCSVALATVLCLPATSLGQFIEGDLYIAEGGGNRIFRVDPSDWSYNTFASNLSYASMLHFHSNGKLLASSYNDARIYEYEPGGSWNVALDAADGVTTPIGTNGIVRDSQNRLYINNFLASEILRYDEDYSNGEVFVDSSDGLYDGEGMAFDAAGNLFVANRYRFEILQVAADGTTTVWDTTPGESPVSMAVRSNGDVYCLTDDARVYHYPGGVAANRTLLGIYGNSLVGQLLFSRDESELYMSLTYDLKLSSLDPDTGAETVLISDFPAPLGMTIFGERCEDPGGFTEFGVGLAGAGGFVPSLSGAGNPSPGGQASLLIRDFVGGADSVLLVGLGQESLSVFGGTVYVSFGFPYLFLALQLPGSPGVPGSGDLDLDFQIPNDAQLCITVYAQHFGVDPAAVRGVSMSNALQIDIGL